MEINWEIVCLWKKNQKLVILFTVFRQRYNVLVKRRFISTELPWYHWARSYLYFRVIWCLNQIKFQQFPKPDFDNRHSRAFLITWPFDRTWSSWMAQLDVYSHCLDAEEVLHPYDRQTKWAISADQTWEDATMYTSTLVFESVLERHTAQSEAMTCNRAK